MSGYTKDGLQEVTKSRLYDLAKYYDLKITYRMTKDTMIDVILEYMNRHIPKPVVVEQTEYQDATSEDDLPAMSAKIRRIYEANRK